LYVGENYEQVKHLGKGGTGDTWAFIDKRSGEQVAIKFLKRPLPKVLLENIKREFLIQAELGFGHENVIKAYEAVLTPTHLCLVMEYARGGSLTAYVADKWKEAQQRGLFLSEDEARFFFKQFLSAVNYCHHHRVVHRDLKLDNTLLDAATPPAIKICDFGFAKTWSEEANMYTQIGTPVYMSPELMNQATKEKGYDGRSVDVWASGILLLVMLLGSFPFDHTEHPDPNTSEAHLEVWLQQVSKRWSEVPHMAEAVKKLSPEIKDLLNRIFVIDASKRVTVQQIKRWVFLNSNSHSHSNSTGVRRSICPTLTRALLVRSPGTLGTTSRCRMATSRSGTRSRRSRRSWTSGTRRTRWRITRPWRR